MALTRDIIALADLSARDYSAWRAFHMENPALYSPYFHPDYAAHVARVKPGCQVLRLLENGQAQGFLPFEGKRCIRPVGAPMTDYHGVIASPDLSYDLKSLLKGTGLSTFRFDALIDANDQMVGSDYHAVETTVMDVLGGAEAWRAGRSSSYRRKQKSNRRRAKKAAEDVGAPRLVTHIGGAEAFEQLMTWKHGQFARTGKFDVLAAGWTEELLRNLWRAPKDGLYCALHGLYFGDRLAAAELGLVSDGVYHSWIVNYDPGLHVYSPGFLLLEEIISASEELGYTRIDLGAGEHEYKRYYDDLSISVKQGYLSFEGFPAMARNLYGAAEHLAEKLPLGPLSTAPAKLRRRYAQISACEPSAAKRFSAMAAAFKPAPGHSA